MSLEKFKNSENLLSAEQMKRVAGGLREGTCGCITYDENGNFTGQGCKISKADALLRFHEGGAGSHWCCDSCQQTDYCNDRLGIQ